MVLVEGGEEIFAFMLSLLQSAKIKRKNGESIRSEKRIAGEYR